MRKLFNFFAAALVMLAAASCEKNEVLPDNNSEGKVVTLKASINNGGTKTSLGGEKGSDGKYPVLWSEGDAIAVIQNGEIYKFVLSSVGDSGQTGTFVLDNSSSYPEFNENGEIKAFYPYDGVSLESGAIKYNVPATQTYVENSFGNGASPMAAYATNENGGLVFNNLFGVVKLQLTGAAGESLRCVEFLSDKAVSGSSIITINDVSSSIILAETPNIEQKKVVMECENPVELSTDQTAPTTVHIAVPGGVEHEFSVYIVTDKGAYYKKVSSAKEIVAGEIKKMGGLNLSGPEFEGKRMSYMENGVYLGEGVAISDGNSTIIWAPKNCGYNPDSYPNGKVYQWGRKYGQSNEASITSSPIAPNDYFANEESYANTLFLMKSNPPGDWLDYADDQDKYPELWKNSEKTSNDPCPEGWRVPTADELRVLSNNNKKKLSDGYKFTGNKHIDSYDGLFLPMAGWFKAWTDDYGFASGTCAYWSSSSYLTSNKRMAYFLSISEYSAGVSTQLRAHGFYVRCVKL